MEVYVKNSWKYKKPKVKAILITIFFIDLLKNGPYFKNSPYMSMRHAWYLFLCVFHKKTRESISIKQVFYDIRVHDNKHEKVTQITTGIRISEMK